ncbi:DUF6745 domain-containing protein [Alkalinema sp. FACHB-956]|uniref:DUF6745 domain-containing protein n=1 Tax=Alkalinema sp. FACHB-956 TaxID=2692768 RepID=UPI00168531CB|nr:hypothetical protein [Alkalinema sp. FACHB-956]MBD2326091.1 hypothetical protein [Alkalinema sp. FACHB-956]
MQTTYRLTPEQAAQLPHFVHTWRSLALSTDPIDLLSAMAAVKAAYQAIHHAPPEVIFSPSPAAIPQLLNDRLKQSIGDNLSWLIDRYPKAAKRDLLQQIIGSPLRQKSIEGIWESKLFQIHHALSRSVNTHLPWQRTLPLTRPWAVYDVPVQETLLALPQFDASIHNCLLLTSWMQSALHFDFVISVMQVPCDLQLWKVMKNMLQQCDWVLPFEKLCIVCDRPCQLRFDAYDRLHAVGAPAVVYRDGFQVFAHEGASLPAFFSIRPPELWQAS